MVMSTTRGRMNNLVVYSFISSIKDFIQVIYASGRHIPMVFWLNQLVCINIDDTIANAGQIQEEIH